MSNVVVITTSLRNRSNSDILAERLIKGAEEAGNQVEHISLKDKKLNFCIGSNCILIDDYKKNIAEWTLKGGTGILFTSVEDAEKQLHISLSGTH